MKHLRSRTSIGAQRQMSHQDKLNEYQKQIVAGALHGGMEWTKVNASNLPPATRSLSPEEFRARLVAAVLPELRTAIVRWAADPALDDEDQAALFARIEALGAAVAARIFGKPNTLGN